MSGFPNVKNFMARHRREYILLFKTEEGYTIVINSPYNRKIKTKVR